MTRKRHTEEPIIAVLKDAQTGTGVQELCRKHSISDATFYKWRAKYAGLEVSDVQRLRQLEDRKPAAETDGGGPSPRHPGVEGDQRKKLVGPKAKGAAAQWGTERFGLSQRRVCRLLARDRQTLRYRSRGHDDEALRTQICEIAQTKRVRLSPDLSLYGYGARAGP